MGKMTKTQAELLAELVDGQTHVATYYEPAKKLVSAGMAEWVKESVLAITPAGRSALEEHNGK